MSFGPEHLPHTHNGIRWHQMFKSNTIAIDSSLISWKFTAWRKIAKLICFKAIRYRSLALYQRRRRAGATTTKKSPHKLNIYSTLVCVCVQSCNEAKTIASEQEYRQTAVHFGNSRNSDDPIFLGNAYIKIHSILLCC